MWLATRGAAVVAAFAPLSSCNRLSNPRFVVHNTPPPLSSSSSCTSNSKTPTYLHAHGGGNTFRHKACRTLGSLAFALSILTRSSTQAALATTTTSPAKEELRANDIILNSLKPGISREEADKLAAGMILDDDNHDIVLGQEASLSSSSSSEKQESVKFKKKNVPKRTSVYDYGQEDYEGDDDEDLDFEFEGDVKESDISPSSSGSTSFAMSSSPSKPTTKMYATATFSILVVPVTWLQTREFLRGRREQRYVEKGLEILQAQKAEYFNITTTSDDSDIQDELKDLKNKKDENGQDEDDDDEDDHDEEEDDDDRPSRPKKPRGGDDDDDDD